MGPSVSSYLQVPTAAQTCVHGHSQGTVVILGRKMPRDGSRKQGWWLGYVYTGSEAIAGKAVWHLGGFSRFSVKPGHLQLLPLQYGHKQGRTLSAVTQHECTDVLFRIAIALQNKLDCTVN